MRTTLPIAHTLRGQPPRSRPWRSRRLAVLCSCIGVFVLVMSLAGLVSYQEYHRDMTLAQDGVQHLQTAQRLMKNLTQGSLDAHIVLQARQEFAKAFSAFGQIKNDLEQVPGVATAVPRYGSLLSTALQIVPVAVELSQAGMTGCDVLTLVIPRLRESLDAKGPGITMEDLIIVTHDVAQIQALLNIATGQISRLQPSDLQIDPRIGSAIATLRTALPGLQMGLLQARTLLSITPTLLGIDKPTSYLIEQLDSTQLRPGGGDIGSYGIVTVSGGRLSSIHMSDTYLLDDPYKYAGNRIPYPSTYRWFSNYLASESWSLHDSNLDADFPTAARYGEQIYHIEGGTTPVQGMIAITPWFIENALKITGPVYVNEYNETITAYNLINRIHYHQLNEEVQGGDVPSPDGHSSLRKRFTELLFEHFFARVRQVVPVAMPQFVNLLRDSLHTKDIQIYLNSGTAEDLLQSSQLASTIQAPVGDSVFIVDANVSSNKANNFITYTLHDQVAIDSSGNAIHDTALTYNWPFSQGSLQNAYSDTNLYRDYVRIYIPPGSALQTQDGWMPQGMSETFGHKVWAGVFTLPYGQTGTIHLIWTVPGAVVHDANGWHYHYLIQRQAGITWQLNLQVILPSCAHVIGNLSNLALNSSHGGVLKRDLMTDSDVGVDYICSR